LLARTKRFQAAHFALELLEDLQIPEDDQQRLLRASLASLDFGDGLQAKAVQDVAKRFGSLEGDGYDRWSWAAAALNKTSATKAVGPDACARCASCAWPPRPEDRGRGVRPLVVGGE